MKYNGKNDVLIAQFWWKNIEKSVLKFNQIQSEASVIDCIQPNAFYCLYCQHCSSF